MNMKCIFCKSSSTGSTSEEHIVPESPDDPLGAITALFPDEKKDLLRLLLLHNISKRLSAWSERHDIPEDIRQEVLAMQKQIDKT
jgi:hypothetical protein